MKAGFQRLPSETRTLNAVTIFPWKITEADMISCSKQVTGGELEAIMNAEEVEAHFQ